jgi:hypothetical protein
MSTTDEARLDALDRRGRAAARTLLDDLAARGGDTLVAEDAGPAPIPAPGSSARPDPTVIHLGRPSVRGGGRTARRWLVAAAVVGVLAAVSGAFTAASRDDGRPAVSSDGEVDQLLPSWVPEGFEPVSALDIPDPAAAGFSADIAVYGDHDGDDPWSATVSVVHLVAGEELLGGRPSGGEAVTVAGHDARLSESEGFGGGRQWEVEWQVDDGRLIVAGPLTPDEVLAAAETATTEPAIDTSGLRAGYSELARGPFTDSLVFTSLFEGVVRGSADAGDGSGLAVTYADPADSGQVRPAVVVARRPGPASAIDLLRLWFTDAAATTVRGRHAVIGRGDELPGSAGEAGVVAVQWAEPEGQLVSVVGFGVGEDAVLQVAEGLRPAGPGEVADLREEHAVAAPREFDDVRDGQVVVASGDSATGRWRIVAEASPQANIGSLTLERLWGAIGATASTTGARLEPPVDVQADISDGTIVIWGVLGVDAAAVTAEAPGREPVTLDTHEVEGWSQRVVADAFPDDHFDPDDTVSVVARDADGEEVARNTTVLDGG